MDARFEAFPDPLDNWLIWDLHDSHFALLGERLAVGLSEQEANSICVLLNYVSSPAEKARRVAVA
ncbi:hypothetical protein [Bradyrhizobium sp. LHD-71]|uniref:hypothetical protein n=1 Tax=Bradyrhizobium sp. LHD-71 TaxID=3072141 RepID=UPI0028103E1C|nr:hypothetical protein [Bradyrhizobium sp. LHD-71]MDQ8732183.1 hypothetical protein [Bradyrhizobium sp. LHD-71]